MADPTLETIKALLREEIRRRALEVDMSPEQADELAELCMTSPERAERILFPYGRRW